MNVCHLKIQIIQIMCSYLFRSRLFIAIFLAHVQPWFRWNLLTYTRVYLCVHILFLSHRSLLCVQKILDQFSFFFAFITKRIFIKFQRNKIVLTQYEMLHRGLRFTSYIPLVLIQKQNKTKRNGNERFSEWWIFKILKENWKIQSFEMDLCARPVYKIQSFIWKQKTNWITHRDTLVSKHLSSGRRWACLSYCGKIEAILIICSVHRLGR